ncbi:GNAT family N-acetyltransferase [Arenibacter sp. GZD96]|uniref:GNAT family N-acetyltransferase n=1 Tax=Aurantibrevibacter litoralis TaxID=3106030 RepID=UPI002AFF35A6|nr:GNAT family N-acetyltransferase [Arenibacter sp. GZD-96]MEA1785285.1 GNAT family N-acetyltransferase [Arenibacter sp. GZD-96]
MNLKRLTSEDYTPALRNEIIGLFQQLNPNIATIPLEAILKKDNSIILVVCEFNGTLVGMASVATYRVISGHKGMIEDVVVDKNHRGRGIGRALMQKVVEEALNLKVTSLLLYTGHHRIAAIALYQKLGFVLKNSGLYTLDLNSKPVV